MNTIQIYEAIGYLASILVAISLMMSSILKLRVINFFGAAFFSLYGFLINSYPVAILNGFIAIANIYYLLKIFYSKEYFSILEFNQDSKYLKKFINFYQKEINSFVPDFSLDIQYNVGFYILRNMVPAGIFIANFTPEGNCEVILDFVTSNYRDFKIGKYLFINNKKYFAERGIKKLISRGGSKLQTKYLKKMGFKANFKNQSNDIKNSKNIIYELTL